ncbi:hypothetical protein CYMTET_37680 [Cymbomonas tetramitiformis]|uniref:glucan 1,4-alpha-glucosidase n=1 Tax=Cymbomonas tetramitiformis TaxID=36881 RepID=A0AAE0CDG5_9CHLO|nr:hypothetical protein CYMTET_37680 [Cymbomonas tetramitiformis]
MVRMFGLICLVFVGILAPSVSADCTPPEQRTDCGYFGIDQAGCEGKGCCWSPANDTPWCFFPADRNLNCFSLKNGGASPFSTSEIERFYGLFKNNININGKGGVVAAPDHNTPGGSYYYHWERDGALTMRALQEVTKDKNSIMGALKAYTQWVLGRQAETDPHGIDVRTEPKYMLPDGAVFTGAWCRPQNDGPGLRATALMMFAEHLSATGGSDYVKEYLWTGDSSKYKGGAIKWDLDYVLSQYDSATCDLWEEVRSSDFFWNRVTMIKALHTGARFAITMSDTASANAYTALAAKLSEALYKEHWNGDYIIEATNREKDGAVIVGLNTGYDDALGMFAPTSAEVASTILEYNSAFCTEYAINRADTSSGVGGVLYGRYPGDVYAGGNPWVLTTAALAQLFYRAASFTSEHGVPAMAALDKWAKALNVDSMPSGKDDVAGVFLEAGDSVLLRLRKHVVADDGHLDEQIDRNDGHQMSARDLTWSYAEVLNAMAHREAAVQARYGKAVE